uniref:uncharacterized protein LOC101311603 n=1 Tax=Fragaria vesca subsp. vesca TaxID=101020 RepID=UPI0005CB3B81|nr:PREDICTED: uncharacterized protein LOC101311603 [Fragaria vesca subsp. vesca]
MGKLKKDIIRLEKEKVIRVAKKDLISHITTVLETDPDSSSKLDEFLKLCKRVEYTIRAWHNLEFQDMMNIYTLFDPLHGSKKLKKDGHTLTSEEIGDLEQRFLTHMFQVMDKSHFKIADNEEIEVANSGQYLLHLPIVVDESKLDNKLLKKYFEDHPTENIPDFSDKYVIFRRGIGLDKKTDWFFMEKVDIIISRIWKYFLQITTLDKVFNKNTPAAPKKRDSESETDEDDFFVERIRLDSMDLSLQNLLLMNTIQEPTFERIIVVYRQATTDEDLPERGIHIKHFKNIPMADLEIVLPEKKNPGLTPMDWLSFIGSAVVGLVAIVTSIETTKLDLWVAFAILSTVIGYIATTYFSFQQNLAAYQSLITESMYEKQLDSGRGTLLNLCDDVIQQEVKEVIICFYVLNEMGKSTLPDLDYKCEWLIKEWYKDEINFDVDDAVKKLEKLEIVTKDSEGLYSTVGLERANKIIGTTTEEVVLSAKYKEMRAESEAHGDHAIGKASVAEPEDAMTSNEERERLLAGFAED